MRKIKTIISTEEKEVIDDILCNICGESLNIELSDSFKSFEGLISSFIGGYGSKIGDMISLDISICEDCLLEKIFPMFSLNPYSKNQYELDDDSEIMWENTKKLWKDKNNDTINK